MLIVVLFGSGVQGEETTALKQPQMRGFSDGYKILEINGGGEGVVERKERGRDWGKKGGRVEGWEG